MHFETMKLLILYHDNGLWSACNYRTKQVEYNTDSEESGDDDEQAHGASDDDNEGKAWRTSENLSILLLVVVKVIAWYFSYRKLLLGVSCSFALIFHSLSVPLDGYCWF